ncbi:MAG TPA: CDP-alcohol phosphatidyltransferase family protein [Streptosporangiaceae bacterium]
MRAIRLVQAEAAPESPVDHGALPTIRLATILGMLATAALLGVVSAVGLGVAGWIAGLATGWAATALIASARMRSNQPAILPADWVTLTRAVLTAGVAGLVAASFGRPVSIMALVTLSTIALILDGVDGQVARRTATATPLGGRLDGEVDAFLILLLSIAVSQDYGSWVLVIGAARYALLLAGWLMPWLAAPLPPRYWRKVVAAVQGIVLTVAVSGVLDRLAGMIAVAVALLLLAESFGRDVIWLYRTGASPRVRRALRLAITVLAVVLLWGDLLAPDKAWQISPAAFIRIPVELLVLVAVALLPVWPRRIVAAVIGILLGVFTLAKILNIAFYQYVDRAFNPVFDWGSIGSALGVVRDTIGRTRTNLLLAALALGLLLLVAAITASAIRITSVAARHRRAAVRSLAGLTAVWAACAGLSLQFIPGSPVASASAVGLAVAQVHATQAAFSDQRLFERAVRSPDPEASVPASDLLTGLRGKDVIIAFVESYGQVSIQDPNFSPGIDAVLRHSTASLARAGWSTQSAWVDAPGYGGISQEAHSTLQAGLWVNSRQRYSELVGSSRFTLSDAFDKAGFRTVNDSPATDDQSFLSGTQFYHFGQLYDRTNVGYHGPSFGYAPMPDQYILSAFQRLELAPGHKPVMAEIDLVSSHSPWAPLPTMVPWNKVGNGSIFDPMRASGEAPLSVLESASKERKAYGTAVQYSLRALTSWVTELNDPNLVLVLLGDEQPDTPITSPGASHNVPISIIARDPSVFRQIVSWHWQAGLLPGRSTPLELMSAFRDQFLSAFSTATSQTASAH